MALILRPQGSDTPLTEQLAALGRFRRRVAVAAGVFALVGVVVAVVLVTCALDAWIRLSPLPRGFALVLALSAGGLLQGAVFSQRPERWRAVVAEVPFVDVVSTMFDASIPLTVNEWDEWGDPRRAEDFAWLAERVPGLYVKLGVRNEARGIDGMLHTEEFDMDEAVLPLGVRAVATLVWDYLARTK